MIKELIQAFPVSRLESVKAIPGVSQAVKRYSSRNAVIQVKAISVEPPINTLEGRPPAASFFVRRQRKKQRNRL